MTASLVDQNSYNNNAGSKLCFQSGGPLRPGAVYVERPADRELLKTLLSSELAYVLAPRQIGKSSLRVHTTQRLSAQGVSCATVDLCKIGSTALTEEQWYFGLMYEIAADLGLPDPASSWHKVSLRSPVHRFALFLQDEVLRHTDRRVVIFIDEIDSVINLPFKATDFFSAIRAIFNARATATFLERLTFCLLGVTTPGELTRDPHRTPFNIGRSIRLEDFRLEEAAPAFAKALYPSVNNPEDWLHAIFHWTDGHPYMTHRLCQEIADWPHGRPEEPWKFIANLVENIFVQRGRFEETCLSNAEDRFINNGETRTLLPRMLRIYGQLLNGGNVPAKGNDPQTELCLCGVAAERQSGVSRVLCVRNRVFATVFDHAWVSSNLVRQEWTDPLWRWQQAGQKDDDLLRGTTLHALRLYATEHPNEVTQEETSFLVASLESLNQLAMEKQRAIEADAERARREQVEERSQAQRRIITIFMGATALLSILALGFREASQRAERNAIAEGRSRREAEKSQKAAEHAKAQEAEQRKRAEAASAGMKREVVRSQKIAAEKEVLFQKASRAQAYAQEQSLQAQHERDRATQEAALATKATWLADDLRTKAESRIRTELSLRAAALALQPKHRIEALYAGMRAAQPELKKQDYIFENWEGLATAAYQVVVSQRFGEHDAGVTSARFFADAKHVLTTSWDGTARIWDLQSPSMSRIIVQQAASLTAAAISSDGQFLATASEDGTAHLWRLPSGKVVRRFSKHEQSLTSVAFSKDGRLLATGSLDQTARIWDTQTGRQKLILNEHLDAVTSVSFSNNGKYLLTASRDKRLRAWEISSGRLQATVTGHLAPILWAEFGPSGSLIVTASEDHTAKLWAWDEERRSIEHLLTLVGHEDSVQSASFSDDDNLLITASADHTAKVWLTRSGRLLRTLDGHTSTVTMATISSDKQLVVTASFDRSARFWEIGKDSAQGILLTPATNGTAAISANVHYLATSGTDRRLRLLNLVTGMLHEFGDPLGFVTGIAFSHQGSNLASVSLNNGSRVWSADTLRQIVNLPYTRQSLSAVAFSGDDKFLAVGGWNGEVQLWHVNQRTLFSTLHAHIGQVNAVAYSRDGILIATGGNDGILKLWSAQSARPLWSTPKYSNAIETVAFSPNSNKVLATNRDGIIQLWNVKTGQSEEQMQHSGMAVTAAAFSPDGLKIITASQDHSLQIWDAVTGRCLRKMENQTEAVTAVAFSSDGKQFIAVDVAGVVRSYILGEKELFHFGCRVLQGLSKSRFLESNHDPLETSSDCRINGKTLDTP